MAQGPNVAILDKNITKLNGFSFDNIHLKELLEALAAYFKDKPKKDATLVQYKRVHTATVVETTGSGDDKLTRADIQLTLQSLVTPETTIIGETGDSWFNVVRTKLPNGARVEVEMQWGHIAGLFPRHSAMPWAHRNVAPF